MDLLCTYRYKLGLATFRSRNSRRFQEGSLGMRELRSVNELSLRLQASLDARGIRLAQQSARLATKPQKERA